MAIVVLLHKARLIINIVTPYKSICGLFYSFTH